MALHKFLSYVALDSDDRLELPSVESLDMQVVQG